MRSLAIECATEACSVALFDDGELVANEHHEIGRGHAERLIPMIARLPNKGRSDKIMVSRGPGSFTGVRIGLAAARALGVAWGAEVTGYPTLCLIASLAQQEHPGHSISVVMNGGHGEWFIQDFDADGRALDDLVSLPVEAALRRPSQQLIAGNRAQEYAQGAEFKRIIANILPDARGAHLIAPSIVSTNIAPLYGRPPDAVAAG